MKQGMETADLDHNALAAELLAAFDARQPVEPFPNLDLATAYKITEDIRKLREMRGERVLGRKIGFTNETIWDEYGVYAPIWGYMYDTSVHELGGTPFDLSPLLEPRIEPEICFGLARNPAPDMDDTALLSCIDWVAHGFEIVQSLFPGWKFTAPDTVASFGLHGALLLGPRYPASAMTDFEITLESNNGVIEHGTTHNVLGSPLNALRHILAIEPPLTAGEMVTTGTLTRAVPVAPGETWRTTLNGTPIKGIEALFA